MSFKEQFYLGVLNDTYSVQPQGHSLSGINMKAPNDFRVKASCKLSLTNQKQFSMVCTLKLDLRNDIKIFKTQVNHKPQASGFTAKF